MLRTASALAVLAVLVIVVTAVTGPFGLTLVAVAAALLLGATVLSLLGTGEEDAKEDGADGWRPRPGRRIA